MSWTDELIAIYDYNCGRKFEDGEPQMLPVAHSTANAQIEMIVDENGNFKGANAVDKSDAVTVIPNSGRAKTGKNPTPYPLDESLKYIAGDLNEYLSDKFKNFSNLHSAYIKQLTEWDKSEYTHKAVSAVLKYILKASVVSDCIKSGVLEINSERILLPKQYQIEVEKVFVRFIVQYDDSTIEQRTWRNKELQNCFIKYNAISMGEKQLCYASGIELPATYVHPIKIIKLQPNAKLFSANDNINFTYLGRFENKEQAVSISYDFSQKFHCALKWLIENQGMNFDSLTLVVWSSMLQPIPDIRDRGIIDYDDDAFEVEPDGRTTAPMYSSKLRKRILGFKEKFNAMTKVMVMGLDAASKGRASISLYTELNGSDFLNNIEKWHMDTAWYRYRGKKVNSFSIYEIVNYAYGTEQKSKDKKSNKKYTVKYTSPYKKNVVLELIQCIIERKSVPYYLIQNLYNKASNPLSYQEESNHTAVLECACGMIRKSIIDRENIIQEGEYLMSYDPNENDRSYLYGCLLAVADKAESEAFDEKDRNVRQTNARRYWNAFAQRPYQTWGVIFANLNPYFDKLGKAQVKYRRRINDILDKMDKSTFENDSRLDNLYLLGYSHYTNKMFDEDIRVNRED